MAALGELQARYPDRLEIVEGDALSFDIATLRPNRIGIVANLPYNVGTRLLLRWLERVERIESMTLMFQKEVAVRITAAGEEGLRRPLGARAVALHLRAPVRREPARLRAAARRGLIGGSPGTRATPLAPADPAALDAVTRAAFGQRRKMLRRAIRTLTPDPQALLQSAGISPEARAETLSVAEFCALARAWAAMRHA